MVPGEERQNGNFLSLYGVVLCTIGEFMPVACALAILFADQWSKRAILTRNTQQSVARGAAIRFHLVPHRSRSFEQPGSRSALAVAWLLALLCAIILSQSGHYFHHAGSLTGFALALGGAAGNLLDILRRQYIINFIDFGWWPAFNLADIAILVGLAAVFLT
jgi:lipoprotein signal peptidase